MSNGTSYQSASILLEALPYIRRFRGTSIVIKLGGAVMQLPELQREFARDIVLLQYVGIKPIVVHGGGPQINAMLKDLAIPSEFIDGHRVTDDASMNIVEMVLSGKINKEITALINQAGGRAVGISGRDGSFATALPYSVDRQFEDGRKGTASLGRVGTLGPKQIQTELLTTLENNDYIPVIAPVALDEEGDALNINADTMAGAVAMAMQAHKLILLTNTPGVLVNEKRVAHLTPQASEELKQAKYIVGGMLPKVDCCVQGILGGVRQAHIINGEEPHSLLLELFTDKGIGTMFST